MKLITIHLLFNWKYKIINNLLGTRTLNLIIFFINQLNYKLIISNTFICLNFINYSFKYNYIIILNWLLLFYKIWLKLKIVRYLTLNKYFNWIKSAFIRKNSQLHYKLTKYKLNFFINYKNINKFIHYYNLYYYKQLLYNTVSKSITVKQTIINEI